MVSIYSTSINLFQWVGARRSIVAPTIVVALGGLVSFIRLVEANRRFDDASIHALTLPNTRNVVCCEASLIELLKSIHSYGLLKNRENGIHQPTNGYSLPSPSFGSSGPLGYMRARDCKSLRRRGWRRRMKQWQWCSFEDESGLHRIYEEFLDGVKM